jgi:hypothetical protein
MNRIVGKASQGKARGRENRFNLLRGREAANAVEDVAGLFFGQHERQSVIGDFATW